MEDSEPVTAAFINRHTRDFAAPPAAVQRWLEAAWSGTADDVFPRDVIRSWRKNPPGADPQAFVPGQTIMGHGPFRFRLVRADATGWRVDVDGKLHGWHGFTLTATATGTRVVHTLALDGGAVDLAVVRHAIAPIHDWAVEALLDRLGDALATGRVPAHTARPMSTRVRATMRVLRAVPRSTATLVARSA